MRIRQPFGSRRATYPQTRIHPQVGIERAALSHPGIRGAGRPHRSTPQGHRRRPRPRPIPGTDRIHQYQDPAADPDRVRIPLPRKRSSPWPCSPSAATAQHCQAETSTHGSVSRAQIYLIFNARTRVVTAALSVCAGHSDFHPHSGVCPPQTVTTHRDSSIRFIVASALGHHIGNPVRGIGGDMGDLRAPLGTERVEKPPQGGGVAAGVRPTPAGRCRDRPPPSNTCGGAYRRSHRCRSGANRRTGRSSCRCRPTPGPRSTRRCARRSASTRTPRFSNRPPPARPPCHRRRGCARRGDAPTAPVPPSGHARGSSPAAHRPPVPPAPCPNPGPATGADPGPGHTQGALRPQRPHRRETPLRGRTCATTKVSPSASSSANSSNSMSSITVRWSTPSSARHSLTLRTSLPAPLVPDP